MIKSSDGKQVLTARDKAIELLAKKIDDCSVENLRHIIGGSHDADYWSMTEAERRQVEYFIGDLRKACKERVLKSRTRKGGK